MHPTKIILTGYRATGKSSVGKLLAQRLSFQFLDMDLEIENREGDTIYKMVNDKGWDYFRAAEKQLLTELIDKDNLVIGSGGGAILHQNVWPSLMNTGYVVWLRADNDVICHRLLADEKTSTQRPSLTNNTTINEVETVMQEREPLYRKFCHCDLDTGIISIEEAASVIEKYFTNIKR